MKWLFSYVVASAVGGFLIVRIFDALFGGVGGAVVSAARAGLFATTWTAITTGLVMRDASNKVRRFRQGARNAKRLNKWR